MWYQVERFMGKLSREKMKICMRLSSLLRIKIPVRHYPVKNEANRASPAVLGIKEMRIFKIQGRNCWCGVSCIHITELTRLKIECEEVDYSCSNFWRIEHFILFNTTLKLKSWQQNIFWIDLQITVEKKRDVEKWKLNFNYDLRIQFWNHCHYWSWLPAGRKVIGWNAEPIRTSVSPLVFNTNIFWIIKCLFVRSPSYISFLH